MRTSSCIVVCCAVILAAAEVHAEAADASHESNPVIPFTAGVEIGGVFPQVVSKLDTGFMVTLEVGYLLPFLAQRFEIYGDVGYNQSKHHQSLTTPQLTTGGAYTLDIEEQHLLFNVGIMGRIFPPRTLFNCYGQVGFRTDLQRSLVTGEAEGADFPENSETATAFGVHTAVGGEFTLGPGAISLEVDFSASDLNQKVTGDTAAGGVGLLLGYHFLF
jgi:hypothetical protein